MKRKSIIVSAVTVPLFIIAALVLLSTLFVWIPDIFVDRVIVLGQMQTSDGDHFRVTQENVGDGYLTRFDHTSQSGQSWHAVFDGDAFKAWSAKFEKTNNVVAVHVLNQRFFYNVDTHAMTYPNGQVRSTDEKAGALTNSPDLFRVAIDPASAQYAAVSKNGRVLAVKDKSGTPLWTNDVAATFGSNPAASSSAKIDSLEYIGNEIVIHIGKRFICVEPQTGKIIRSGISSS